MRQQSSLLERGAVCAARLRDITPVRLDGRVTGLSGLVVDVDGLRGHASIGNRLVLSGRDDLAIPSEIVGFRGGMTQAMPFGALDGLGPGSVARLRPGGVGT